MVYLLDRLELFDQESAPAAAIGTPGTCRMVFVRGFSPGSEARHRSKARPWPRGSRLARSRIADRAAARGDDRDCWWSPSACSDLAPRRQTASAAGTIC